MPGLNVSWTRFLALVVGSALVLSCGGGGAATVPTPEVTPTPQDWDWRALEVGRCLTDPDRPPVKAVDCTSPEAVHRLIAKNSIYEHRPCPFESTGSLMWSDTEYCWTDH